uniref:Endosome-associated-trafficking regulator 1 n=1 Tax=Corvus moneduloides TaxID=1196302 RepID=A0A8C3DB96_CORMO
MMRPSPLSKSNDSRDDNQTEDLGEPRLSYMVKDKRVGLAKPALEFEEEDQEFQEPFYEDMGMSDSLAGDEEPSLTYHLPGHQRGPALLKASTAPSGFHESFQHSSGQHLGTEATATRACAGDHYVGHPESSTGADAVLVGEDVMPREEYDVLRKQYDRLEGENAALRKDNAMVRRMLNTFQYNLKRQVCMVSSLQDQLKASQAEREREVRELQSLAQQSECHLQLMSQRVLDAEINMERLKQKIFILQGQLEKSKLENENRRTDWPGSSEAQLRLQQAKPPRAHNGQKWLPQAAPASGMLPVVAEVLESTRKILKF